MTPQGLINECQLSGVLVHLVGGKLKLKGEPDAVRIAADRLRPFKSEIVQFEMKRMAEPISDLVRDFIEDGLTREEAEALAAISVQPCPPDEWLALIAELDALIVRYCLATGETKTAIQSARCGQSLASIPESLAWFRREVARIDGAKVKPVPTPAPKRDGIIEGSRAGAKAAQIKLHQPITKELNQ